MKNKMIKKCLSEKLFSKKAICTSNLKIFKCQNCNKDVSSKEITWAWHEKDEKGKLWPVGIHCFKLPEFKMYDVPTPAIKSNFDYLFTDDNGLISLTVMIDLNKKGK